MPFVWPKWVKARKLISQAHCSVHLVFFFWIFLWWFFFSYHRRCSCQLCNPCSAECSLSGVRLRALSSHFMVCKWISWNNLITNALWRANGVGKQYLVVRVFVGSGGFNILCSTFYLNFTCTAAWWCSRRNSTALYLWRVSCASHTHSKP